MLAMIDHVNYIMSITLTQVFLANISNLCLNVREKDLGPCNWERGGEAGWRTQRRSFCEERRCKCVSPTHC